MPVVGKRMIAIFTFLPITIAVSSVETACDARPGANPGRTGETVARNDKSAISTDVDTNKIEGQWTGQQGTNRVLLTITSGGKTATWEYRGQRSCTLDAGDSGTDKDNRQIYVFKKSNGGFCDKLTNGALYLKKQGGNLSYTVIASDNKQIEDGTLSMK